MKRNILKCFALIVTMVAVSVNISAQLVWDGTSSSWTHGTGTATDPYLIETPQNLAWLSDMVNNGSSNYSGVYFKQTEDFNMNGNSFQFNVIGSNTNGGTYFSGHYDGNFKSISNLVISDLSQYVGLFGFTSTATFKRICVKGVGASSSSSDKRYVGAISAYSTSDTIFQCSCIGDVFLSTSNANPYECNIGGLVGYTYNSVLEESSMAGNVRSERYYYDVSNAGGLVGYATSYNSTSGYLMTIKSCYFVGTVKVSGTATSGNSGCYSRLGLLIGFVEAANQNTRPGVVLTYNMNNCYAVGTFIYPPGNYLTGDVMIGGSTQANYVTYRFSVINSNNYYCGTNLSNTSLYATKKTDVYMQSAACPILLNMGVTNGPFSFDYDIVNGGYPIFGYQQLVKYYTITANCDASMGRVSGTGTFANNSVVSLQAEAAEGYVFTGWGDGNIENPRTVTVSSDSTYNAIFTKNAWTIHVKQNCHVTVQ